MEFALRGDADGGPAIRLDHEAFSYAGKFVMTNAGKAVAKEADEIVAAASFNRDRSDDATLWIRYLTVRADRRGEGIAPRLCAFAADRLLSRFERVRIAVNNPFAYEALYKAGFGYTREQTGIAELVLERPSDRSRETYQQGFDVFRERELSNEEESFLEQKRGEDPPTPVRVDTDE